MFFKLFNRKFKTIDKVLESYSTIHGKISERLDLYESDEKILKCLDTDRNIIYGVKGAVLNLESLVVSIDSIILDFSNKNAEDFYLTYSNKIPKATTVPFNSNMLINSSVEYVFFPEILGIQDVEEYSAKLNSSIQSYYLTISKIKELKKANSELHSKGLYSKGFLKCLELNESYLVSLKLIINKELLHTKFLLGKTFNFIDIPIDFNRENWKKTIIIHSYLRKLVFTNVLNKKFLYMRYTNNIPSFLKDKSLELGFYSTVR